MSWRSRLCTITLDGEVETLLETDRHIEAPNWHRDGRLIVNAEGRIWALAPGADMLSPIDTGAADRCNNDHGLMPDGETLVISDSAQTEGSCIYLVPLAGGAPRRVTAHVPSYWHGVSPDGARLAYVGRRGSDAHFDIFTCAPDGSGETRLTRGEGHHDGPDYTPDGAWIWFNSDRGGTMDLWRIRPDGSDAQQMSDDERVNWFPHPSPDGRHVAYLAYEEGTEGHPPDREVELRVMPAGGGAPRVLRALHGGQGTINVPSWAPDSGRFAFVEYAR